MTESKQRPTPVTADPIKVERNLHDLASGIGRPLGYLAGPITSDPHRHMADAAIISAELCSMFPIELFTPQASVALEVVKPRRPDEWLRLDGCIIARCDFLYRLPGVSNGADAEEVLATRLGIPILRSDADLRHWLTDRAIALGTAMRGQSGGPE
jgi:hypothetical protein